MAECPCCIYPIFVTTKAIYVPHSMPYYLHEQIHAEELFRECECSDVLGHIPDTLVEIPAVSGNTKIKIRILESIDSFHQTNWLRIECRLRRYDENKNASNEVTAVHMLFDVTNPVL